MAGPGGFGPPARPSAKQRAQLRRQARLARAMKMTTLTVVALLLLGGFPVYLGVKSVAKDPVFAALDALALPSWAAAGEPKDNSRGNRWCIGECRLRDRTWQSDKGPTDTQAAYFHALTQAGWRPRTEGCPDHAKDGIASCWHRDEYVLDLWVRAPICDQPPPRPIPGASRPAANPTPSGGTTGGSTSGAGGGEVTSDECPGALVTVKVYNAIDYHPSI
jgi:hypothetical protein